MVIKCGIYIMLCKVTGLSYIGQSVNIDLRLRAHFYHAFNPRSNEYNTNISRAIRNYGKDAFICDILELCDSSKLNEREIYYISQYNSVANGYNIQYGGNSNRGSIKYSKWQISQAKSYLMNSNLRLIDIMEILEMSYTINTGILAYDDKLSYPLRKIPMNKVIIKQQFYCRMCGAVVSDKDNLCRKCFLTSVYNDKPSRDYLKKLIRETSFEEIGRMYGVTGNAVKRWCTHYNLPNLKSIIKQIDDIEWSNL